MRFEVWMQAENDMGQCIVGGGIFGEAEADTWEEACVKVMAPLNDSCWRADKPTRYWGRLLCQSHAEAWQHIPKEMKG